MVRIRWALTLGGLACLGVASSLYATRFGTGLIADSKFYLEAAHSLLQGRGFAVPTGPGVVEPVTNWPPLFSACLAGLGVVGVDLRAAARWLNASLFGGTIVLAMVAIRHITRGSTWAPLLGGFLMATSVDLLLVHSQAGSESLFLFLGLLGLLLVGLHLERSELRCLAGAAAATGLAFLTRYPGIVLVATGLMGLLWLGQPGRRVRDAVVFGSLSTFPMVVWMTRNWLLVKQPIGSFRVLVVHPLTPAQWRLGFDTVWGWLLPGHGLGSGLGGLTGHVSGIRWIVLAGLAAGGVAATWRWREWNRARVGDERDQRLLAAPLLSILLTFIVLYLIFMVASISLFDATIPLDRRLLSPVLVTALILVIGLCYRLTQPFEGSPVARSAIALGAGLVSVIYADAALRWVHQAHAKGLGYADRAWQQSAVLRKVEALRQDLPIYTNGEDAVTLVTDRLAIELPRKVRLNTGQPNPNYELEVAAMVDQLRAGAVLVYLRRITWRDSLYGSEAELRERLHLRLRESAPDGSIYDVAP